ncbi:MAG: HK97 family phage prohead protease [Alphaproteobacteria bacterium]|nr:HK97 family phage prohead protease [Alphaproteobacteria bacterium]
MRIETRRAELRAEGGRRLSGVVIRYGDVAEFPWGRERFTPGAFAPIGDVLLNAQHDRRTPLARTGAGLELRDGPDSLELEATLPNTRTADDVLELVRAGVLRGLSIEFEAKAERMESGVRVVDKARLAAVGVVDTPAYPQSEVEARRRGERRTWVRGGIKYGVKAHCACLDGECDEVFFRPEVLEVLDSAIATVGRATEAVGSVRGGSLRVRNTPERFEFEIDDAGRDTVAGRQLADLDATGTPVYARPIIDQDGAAFEDIEGVRHYDKAPVRALLLKPIMGPDERAENWETLDFEGGRARPARRRIWL